MQSGTKAVETIVKKSDTNPPPSPPTHPPTHTHTVSNTVHLANIVRREEEEEEEEGVCIEVFSERGGGLCLNSFVHGCSFKMDLCPTFRIKKP